MIRLTCTQCHAELNIDDGFAGGVCRCQHCGTIQTVPKKTRRDTDRPASKTLYRKPDAARGKGESGTDLDALADAVTTSSGLSSKRLRKKTIEYAPTEKPRRPWLLWVGGGAGALLLGMVLIFVFRSSPVSPALVVRPASIAAPGLSAPGSAASGPEFLGVSIDDPTVIFVLDRGSGSAEWFSYLLEATFRSTETLGSERRFQILFWSNGETDAAYPSGSPEFATDSALKSARTALDSIEARGQSEAIPALTRALKSQPALIILATGKGSQLDDSFAQQVIALRGNSTTRIDTFDIADSEIGPGLTNLAKQTGGVPTLISVDSLKAFAKQ